MKDVSPSSPPTPRPKILYGLQHLRGFAALLVLCRHAAKYSVQRGGGGSFELGQAGVDIFFLISGVVIYLTGRSLTWHVFARRRIVRIVPLYWLALLAACLSTLFTPQNAFWATNTLTSFFFIPSHDTATSIFPPIVAGWSLNYEMYFYVICTAVLLLTPKRLFLPLVSVVVLAGIALGAPLAWSRPLTEMPGPLILLLPISCEFVAGLWLAAAWNKGFRTPLYVNVILALAAIAWFAVAPAAQPYTIWRPLSWGIPAAALLWAVISSEEVVAFGKWRPGLMMGDASYALYLTHPIVLSVEFAILHKAHIHLPFIADMAVAIVSCVIVGLLTHRLIELPVVRIAGRLLGLAPKTISPASLRSADAASPETPSA